MKNQVFNPYLPCYEYIADGEPHSTGAAERESWRFCNLPKALR